MHRLVQFLDVMRAVSLCRNSQLLKAHTVSVCGVFSGCGSSISHTPRFGDHHKRRRNMRARGWRGLAQSSVFGIGGTHGTHGWTASAVACTRSALKHAGGRRAVKAPPLTKELLLTAGGFWEKETKFPLRVWLLVGWPRSSGWFHYPQVYGQHKLESMGYKRGGGAQSWDGVGVGWIWKEWWVNMIKIHCMHA